MTLSTTNQKTYPTDAIRLQIRRHNLLTLSNYKSEDITYWRYQITNQ